MNKTSDSDDGTSSSQLPRDTEVYVLDMTAIRTGDVILTASPGQTTSDFIRLVTDGRHSHAILAVQPPNALESADYGVIRFRLDRLAVRDPRNAVVLRPTSQLRFDPDQLVGVGEALIGRAYADLGAVFSMFPLVPDVDRGRFFCSQLVAHCFAEAGSEIVPGESPEKVTPSMLAASEMLDEQPDVWKKTTIGELLFPPMVVDGPIAAATPNELLMSAFRSIADKVAPTFLLHDFKIETFDEALICLLNARKAHSPSWEVLDTLLAGEMKAANLPAILAGATNEDDLVRDILVARHLLVNPISKDRALQARDFFAEQVRIGEQTVAERHQVVHTMRGSFFMFGLESHRQKLALDWESYVIHQRFLQVQKRMVHVLATFITHEGDMGELATKFAVIVYRDWRS